MGVCIVIDACVCDELVTSRVYLPLTHVSWDRLQPEWTVHPVDIVLF